MKKLLTTLIVLAALHPRPARAQNCPQKSVPVNGWTSRVDEVKRSHAQAVADLDAYLFTLTGKDEDRLGLRTDGFLVVHHGEIIYERYARNFGAKNRHITWSVSKSFTNAITGAAVQQGRLSVDDSICAHYGITKQEHCAVTVRHLLAMGSGFDWLETYEDERPAASSVLAMLYGVGSDDMARMVAGSKKRADPGTTWMYSSGDSTLLARVVTNVQQPVHGPYFPWTTVFDRIGATDITWERDASGTFVGSSYVYATPRDMARFGLLYLHDGCWGNERILPEGWVTQSATVDDGFKREPVLREADDVYGWQFWLNADVSEQGITHPFPDVPTDMFAARGHWGQAIVIIPSLDLVVVRVADDREGVTDFNEYVKRAIALTR